MFGPILFSLSTAQDGSGSGIAIDNVQLGNNMLVQLKKVKQVFYFSSDLDDNGTGHVAPTKKNSLF